MLDRRSVVFFGTPDFAVPSLESLAASEFRPRLVVTQPARPAGRGRRVKPSPVAIRAHELGLRLLEVASVRDREFLQELTAVEPWIAVVVAFGQIFPQALLDLPQAGCVNVHASLLPKYRGAAPIQAAIAAGETETGVSTMLMSAGMDEGPVFLRRQLVIDAEEMAPRLAERLAGAGSELLLETLRGLAAGALTAAEQDHDRATYAAKIAKADGVVDWCMSSALLFNRYRAYTPWPGLSSTLRGEPVKIRECRRGARSAGRSEPGTIVEIAEGVRVACGDDTTLEITVLQRPGRKPLAADTFARGERLEIGERFALPVPVKDEAGS